MAKMTVYHGGYQPVTESRNPNRSKYKRFWHWILLHDYKRTGATMGKTLCIQKLYQFMM